MIIKCFRVSAAASGTKYNYWGCAQYKLDTDNWKLSCVSAATSIRRSLKLAQEDCEREAAEADGAIITGQRGYLHGSDVDVILTWFNKHRLNSKAQKLRAYRALTLLTANGR